MGGQQDGIIHKGIKQRQHLVGTLSPQVYLRPKYRSLCAKIDTSDPCKGFNRFVTGVLQLGRLYFRAQQTELHEYIIAFDL